MTWFKVDDQLHDHKKMRRLGRDRMAASGLWLHCGSWCGDNLSDGFVPEEVVARWDPKFKLAQRLIEVSLWSRAEVDGEPGFQFHQWQDHQPTKADVHKRREETRERVRKYRAARAASSAGSNAVTNATGSPERSGNVLDPDPTRPDPTRTSYGSTDQDDASASEVDDRPGFDDFWAVWPRKIAKAEARKKFDAAVRKGDDPTLIVDAASAQIGLWSRDGKDVQYIPHATTWLHQRRYEDEPEKPRLRAVGGYDSQTGRRTELG